MSASSAVTIRDPLHQFIHLDEAEQKVLDSRPFQRLRQIHQLALGHLVYPAATHRRFEHSLGVMELAGRIYDVATAPQHIRDESVRQAAPLPGSYEHLYWRRVLRMAALCHDIGHLPFSHAAERVLLPDGWRHEDFTRELILSQGMAPVWNAVKLVPEHVAKLAVSPDVCQMEFTDWERALSQIITADALGADRMDYLGRDAYHAGIAHGKFDYPVLSASLRLLPWDETGKPKLALGIEAEGLHAAESLLLARYYLYMSLYLHPIRRILDVHLCEFLAAWLPSGRFSIDLEEHLNTNDNDVWFALTRAERDPGFPGHDPARRIVRREHFRLLYKANAIDLERNDDAGLAVYSAAKKEFGDTPLRYVSWKEKKQEPIAFPVRWHDGRLFSSLALSEPLQQLPRAELHALFVEPKLQEQASIWLAANREALLGSE